MTLPSRNTSFVGREQELEEIVALLRGADCRLLTLTGSGGSGKTRLALEAAYMLQEHFADGAAFEALQPVSHPTYLAATIAEAVGLAHHGARDIQAQLQDFLSDKQLLLVLDNFEHLLHAAPLVSTLLAAAPELKVLATSREVLNLQEEWSRHIAGLPYPQAGPESTAGDLTRYGAVRLFVERARQARASFPLAEEQACVARICRLVEGLPLALELAASWLRTLSCAEVAAEIERNVDFLATSFRNVPARHRSMRAVFEQSWRLLTPEEQTVYARLSVFHGGCTREGAAAVAGASLADLQGLIDKSLLQATPAGRYLTHELLRQFAHEQLAADSAALADAQRRHAEYYARLLHRQEARLRGAAQQDALRVIDADLDNVRVAWRQAVEQHAEELVEQAMGSLFLYYQMRSRPEEGLETFRLATQRLGDAGEPLLTRLQLLETWFASGAISDPEPTLRFYRTDFHRVQALADDERMAMALCQFAWMTARLDDRAPLEQFYAEYLAYHRERGNRWAAAWAAYSLGTIPHMLYRDEDEPTSELAASLPYLEESIALFRELGNPWAATYALHVAGQILLLQQEYERAQEMFRESLQICRDIGDTGGVAFALHCLGEAASALQEYEGSWRYLTNALQISYRHRNEMVEAHLYELAAAFAGAGQAIRAVELFTVLLRESDRGWIRSYVPGRLAELAEMLPEEQFAAAQQSGERLDLATLVDSLAAEFGSAEEEQPAPRGTTASRGDGLLVEPLTDRELELLLLVAEGLSNREIADRLTVTVGTVKKHLNNIFGKLQVTSRTQAVARARTLALIR